MLLMWLCCLYTYRCLYHQTTTYSKVLPDHCVQLGKKLAGGNLPSLAKAVIAHQQLYEEILKQIHAKINNECSRLCQRQTDCVSLLRKAPLTRLLEWDWKFVIDELAQKAPTVLSVLSSIATHNDHRNAKKVGSCHYPGIVMSAAIILKERNREMTGIQSLTSLILFNSRVEKQVLVCSYFDMIMTIQRSLA